MRRTKNRSWQYVAKWLGFLVLCVGLTGETCTDEKGIQLVVGALVEQTFQARGSTNTYNDTEVINVVENADINQLLADNEFENFEIAFLEASWFKISKKDPVPGRTVSGQITVDGLTLISYTSVPVNDDQYAFWTPVPMTDNGRNYINSTLVQYFLELFNEDTPVPPDPVFTFQIVGDSTPVDEATNFDWDLRLRVTLVGEKLVEIPNF